MPPPSQEREVRLARPEPVNYAAEDAKAVRAAFAHAPRPIVAPVLIAVNVLVFVAVALKTGTFMTPSPEVLRESGGTYGPAVSAGEWWRLGTAMFLHAGPGHLAFNMAALVVVGRLTERMIGHVSLLVVYLLAGLAGSITSIYVHPFAVGVGASGSIFGLFGAQFAYLTLQRASLPGDVVQSLRNSGVAFVGYSLLFGVTHIGIDTPAHLGGLVAGALVGAGLASPFASASAASRATTRVLVGALGVSAAAALALQLPATDDWPGALRSLATLEATSPAYVERAGRDVATGTTSAAQMATLLDSRVLGPWRAHRQVIANLKNLPSREREIAQRTLSYMDHRIAAWQLQADAFRHGDMTLIEKSAAEQSAANAAAQDLVRSFGQRRAVSRQSLPSRDEGAREFRRVLEVAQQLERAALLRYDSAIQRVRQHTLSDAEFAALIERDILKSWDAHWHRIAELRATGRVEAARQGMEIYMRLSSEAWHLTAKAFRTRSPEVMKEADAVRVRAAAAAASIVWERERNAELRTRWR